MPWSKPINSCRLSYHTIPWLCLLEIGTRLPHSMSTVSVPRGTTNYNDGYMLGVPFMSGRRDQMCKPVQLTLTSPLARRIPVQSMNANGSLWRSNSPLETARYTASVLFSRSSWSLGCSPPFPGSKVSTMQFVNRSCM